MLKTHLSPNSTMPTSYDVDDTSARQTRDIPADLFVRDVADFPVSIIVADVAVFPFLRRKRAGCRLVEGIFKPSRHVAMVRKK